MQATIRFFLEAFMYLAGLGLMLVFSGFAIALLGNEELGSRMAEVLFPGLFVVWFPTVFVMGQMTRNARRREVWKIGLSGCPAWMRSSMYCAVALGGLMFLYFVVFSSNQKKPPLVYFGSGHMIIFYSVAFCSLYSALHSPELMDKEICAQGHEVSSSDAFCPTCGVDLAHGRGALP